MGECHLIEFGCIISQVYSDVCRKSIELIKLTFLHKTNPFPPLPITKTKNQNEKVSLLHIG